MFFSRNRNARAKNSNSNANSNGKNVNRKASASSGNNNSNASGDRGRKMGSLIFLGVVIFVIAAALTIIITFYVINSGTSDQSKFSINYTVSPDENLNMKILRVNMELIIDKLSSEKFIDIYKSRVLSDIDSCKDNNGNDVLYDEGGALLSIGPISEAAGSVTVSYIVRVGDKLDYYNAYGDLYEDLLVFSGDSVLMTPYIDMNNRKKIDRYISSISFKLLSDYDWKAIIPYAEPLSDDLSFTIEKPTWSVFNAIDKSSFCFGQFERLNITANADIAASGSDAAASAATTVGGSATTVGGSATTAGGEVFVDKSIAGSIPPSSWEALVSFMRYYEEHFGKLSPDAPLVLLRNSAIDNALILGGVGAKGAAISAELKTAADCERLSATLFHLFFDSKIKSPNLRYPPNNWIYQGLSDYCVIKSPDYLSRQIKDGFSIEIVDEPELTYLDYLYFSLKEPDFLITNPAMEGVMSYSQEGFYLGVKVPVMIDFINYAIEDSGGGDFFTALLEKGGSEADLDIDKLLKSKCGKYYASILQCFSGNAIVPNFNNYYLDDIFSQEEITSHLTEAEGYFTELFNRDSIDYSFMPLYVLDPEKINPEVIARNVSYNTDEVQNGVKSFSKTLDQLMMQYALFANIAGFDDITDPEILEELFSDENINKWLEFCESLGYEISSD